MSAQPLEQDAVEELTRELLLLVKSHYLRRPKSRATAQEVLNATAIVVAHIIAAARECGDEAGAREFFELALEQQLAEGMADDGREPSIMTAEVIPFRRPDVSINHPTLGRSVKNGATGTCSKCGHTIPEDDVPLIIWNSSGDFMWVYCSNCDRAIVGLTVQRSGATEP